MEKTAILLFILLHTILCAQFSMTVDGQIGGESGLDKTAGMKDEADLVLSPSLESEYRFKLLGQGAKLGAFGSIDYYGFNSVTDKLLEINGKLKQNLNEGAVIEGISVSRITQSGIDIDLPADYWMYTGAAEYRYKMKHQLYLKYTMSLMDVNRSSRWDLKQTIKPSFTLKHFSMFYPGISIPVSSNYSSDKPYRYWSYGVQLMLTGMINTETFYFVFYNYNHRFYPKEKKKDGMSPEMILSSLNFNLSKELSPNLDLYLDYVFYSNAGNLDNDPLFSNKISAGITWVH